MKHSILTLTAIVTLFGTVNAAPTIKPTAYTGGYEINVEVFKGVLLIESSAANVREDMHIRVAEGFYLRERLRGRHLVVYKIPATVVEVRLGAWDNNGSISVAAGNPYPDGLVYSAPVDDVDAITVDLRGGDDTLFVGDMNLPINARLGSGNDVCECQSTGDVFISGGYGHDFIDCNDSGPAEISGGPGNDEIEGSLHDDVIRGDSGNDDIIGGSGNDLIDGGRGDDYVNGWYGHDVVQGGDGADRVDGGGGIDILIGSNLELASWPAPDSNGIRFTRTELEQLLPFYHTDDQAGDRIYTIGNDFVIWWRFQDWIDFPDPDGWSPWINYFNGRVWRAEE